MKLKSILTISALAAGIATGGVASADHGDRYDRAGYYDDRGDLDVIGTAHLRSRRGEVHFPVTERMTRDDALVLWSDSSRLRILQIELEYRDGRTERLRGRDLRNAFRNGDYLTIQVDRPRGLRHVYVSYALPRGERRATLQLAQLEGDRDHRRDRRRGRY